MKKFYAIAFFSINALNIGAQTKVADGNPNLSTSDERFRYINPYDGRDVPLVGERFFNDSTYRSGELQTSKKLYTTELKYRFDQIERTIQVKFENGKEMYLDEKNVLSCKLFIDGKTVLFEQGSIPNGRTYTLLQVIYKSPTMRLMRDLRKYIFRVKSENLDGYSSEKVYDDIRKDYRYYFNRIENSVLKEVKVDPRSFIDVMPEKREVILKLFKAAKAKGELSVTKLAEIMKGLDVKEEKEEGK